MSVAVQWRFRSPSKAGRVVYRRNDARGNPGKWDHKATYHVHAVVRPFPRLTVQAKASTRGHGDSGH